jgi:hypothetical protein
MTSFAPGVGYSIFVSLEPHLKMCKVLCVPPFIQNTRKNVHVISDERRAQLGKVMIVVLALSSLIIVIIRVNLPETFDSAAQILVVRIYIYWIIANYVIGVTCVAFACKERKRIAIMFKNFAELVPRLCESSLVLLEIRIKVLCQIALVIICNTLYAMQKFDKYTLIHWSYTKAANALVNITWNIYNAVFPFQLGIFLILLKYFNRGLNDRIKAELNLTQNNLYERWRKNYSVLTIIHPNGIPRRVKLVTQLSKLHMETYLLFQAVQTTYGFQALLLCMMAFLDATFISFFSALNKASFLI